MKDQMTGCRCKQVSADDEMSLAQKHADHVYERILKLKKRNIKLYKIVRDSEFSKNFWNLQDSLDEIQSKLEDLAPNELLTPQDAKDRGELDNPPLLYGDV